MTSVSHAVNLGQPFDAKTGRVDARHDLWLLINEDGTIDTELVVRRTVPGTHRIVPSTPVAVAETIAAHKRTDTTPLSKSAEKTLQRQKIAAAKKLAAEIEANG